MANESSETRPVLMYLSTGGHDDPDDLFNEVASPAWQEAIARGQGKLEAVLAVHGQERASEFAHRAAEWVKETVWALPKSTLAVAYGRAVLIELAAWWSADSTKKDRYVGLAEGEGIAFYPHQEMHRVLALPGERIRRAGSAENSYES